MIYDPILDESNLSDYSWLYFLTSSVGILFEKKIDNDRIIQDFKK